MNIEYAREILVALADGVNPATGELLSAEDVCNQPDVIRALHTVLNTLGNASSAPKKTVWKMRVSPGVQRKTTRCARNTVRG